MDNVILFGETGGGKSSTVNLLFECEVATVSDSAIGCTFEYKKYDAPEYALFDTAGLSEGQKGKVPHAVAIQQLVRLLRSLENGVSLLVLVMEKGRIKSLHENYKLLVDAICASSVPVILLISHCEVENNPGDWWRENKVHFDDYGMRFNDVVSGSCMDIATAPDIFKTDKVMQLIESTRKNLQQSIDKNKLSQGYNVGKGWQSWVLQVLPTVLKLLTPHFHPIVVQAVTAATELDLFQDSLRDRIYNYLIENGHTKDKANAFALQIVLGLDLKDGTKGMMNGWVSLIKAKCMLY